MVIFVKEPSKISFLHILQNNVQNAQTSC